MHRDRARRATPPEGTTGVLIAIAVLAVVLGGAALIAWLLSGAVASALPKAPPYLILVVFVPLLIALMLTALRLLPWLQSWYYLVPALVFLLAFTALPIVLTVNYAFTNYSGQNSGAGDTALKTGVSLSTDRKTLTFQGTLPGDEGTTLPQFLDCADPSCAGETAVLYDEEGSVPVFYKIASVSGKSVTLLSPVAPSFEVTDATRLNRIRNVGLENFRQIFGRASVELIPVFIWTVTFAFLTVIINALAGLILGILLYNPRLKGRNIYRTLLFLPWAIPAVITVQMWVALFNQQFGVVNKALGLLGFAAVPWLGDPLWAKVSVLVVNLWLGFPYMMTATISALSTISEDLYEAASIDGASRWQQILNITLPLLQKQLHADAALGLRLQLQQLRHHLPADPGRAAGGRANQYGGVHRHFAVVGLQHRLRRERRPELLAGQRHRPDHLRADAGHQPGQLQGRRRVRGGPQMTALPHRMRRHDTSFVYVHREPGPLRRAAPWVLLGLIVAALIALIYYLGRDMAGRPASFTIYKVSGGWLYFLGFLVVASGVLALTSLIGQRLGIRRTGKKIKYSAVLGVQLTHLFLILVVLIAIYPLFYVVLAAFDPKNSLYAFPNFDAPTIIQRSGLLPSFSGLSTENFAKLFDGVQIPGWELVLAVLAGAAIAVLIFTAPVRRIRHAEEGRPPPPSSGRAGCWSPR